MEELVTIIIPVHNSSKYLTNCINSVLNQTYKNIEIIAVENGSTDNSLEVLNNYKAKIKIEILKESSIGKARNIGIEKSKGKYIMFLDSDDEIEETFIEKLIHEFQNDKVDLVVSNIFEHHEETNTKTISKEYPYKKISKEEIINNLEKFNYGPCNKLFKSEIIKKLNLKFPEFIKYEDLPFVLTYITNTNEISKVEEALYIYNIHKESEQTTVDEKIFDIILSLNECKKVVDKNTFENLYIRIITTYILKTKYIKDKRVRSKFIKEAYKELNKNYKEWKKSSYIKSRSLIKRLIITNKSLLILYTNLFIIFKS